MGRCAVKGCAQDGPHPALHSPLRWKNKTSRLPERRLTVSTHLDGLRPYRLFYGVPALYQSTWAFVLVKSCQKSCSGQGQMSFVAEQMRPCFVPFLSRPPGWVCSGTLSPKLPCPTSAVAAQGTSLPQMQSSCVGRKGAAAAQLPGSGHTPARWGVRACARLPLRVSWPQEVTRLRLNAVTPAPRMQSSRTWGSTGVATAESARPSRSRACLSYSSLCSNLPIYTPLAR